MWLILITFQVRFLSQLSNLSSYFIAIRIRRCMLISYSADFVLLQTICNWKRTNVFGRTGKKSYTVYRVLLLYMAILNNSVLLLKKKDWLISYLQWCNQGQPLIQRKTLLSRYACAKIGNWYSASTESLNSFQ